MGRQTDFFSFLLIFLLQILVGSAGKTHLCRRDQSTALLKFKQAVTVDASASVDCEENGQISSPKTESWNLSKDCCRSWDGVTCDELTGKVISLELSCSQLTGVMDSDSSLFQLSNLQRLNLAYNDFSGSEISTHLGNFSSLTHLNLSSSEFSGQFPNQILSLSNLVSLDLSFGFQDIQIDHRTFRLLLQNLTQLRDVFLANTDISSTVPKNISASIRFLNLIDTFLYGRFPVDIFRLPYLRRLELSSNPNLTGEFPVMMKGNSSISSNLRYLDLSTTGFSGTVPESIGNLKLLNFLDISSCNFWGQIPESLGNLTQIRNLILFSNNFIGRVPSTFSNLDQLIRLDLSTNALEGELPNFFGEFKMLTDLFLADNYFHGSFPSSVTNLTQLKVLDLSNNSLTGPIPPLVSEHLNLRLLFLGENSFNGTIPSWIFSLPSLRFLNLKSNRFTGQIHEFQTQSLLYIDFSENLLSGSVPKSLSKLENLTNLFLSSNNFSGNVDVSMFASMNQLKILDLSSSGLSLTNDEANTSSLLPASLGTLFLSSCNVTDFDFLKGANNLARLDLSNNIIRGEIPKWMGFNWSEYLFYFNVSSNFLTTVHQIPFQNLVYLDLSSNLLQGPMPVPPISIMVFFAPNNNISGEIPSLICNLSSLNVLDLSNNSLSGVIPGCFGNSSNKLSVLDMHMNRLQGQIPEFFETGISLRSLNLRNNQLEGTVPKSLAYCKELEVLDFGNNNLNGTFPSWLGVLPKLQVLSLRSNGLFGPLTTSSTIGHPPFPSLRIVDLSRNNLSGTLPSRFFEHLNGIMRVDKSPSRMYIGEDYYKDSVFIVIKGQEIQLVRILTVFATVDFSSNKFAGQIPGEIGELLSLRGLSLSHNILGGQIPAVLGNLSLLESLDLSSNQIVGAIPRQLTALTYLGVLNLSDNHLVGSIPLGKQFATFENDSYIGNPGLCGFPLSRLCEDNVLLNSPPLGLKPTNENNQFFRGFTWESILIGYSFGIVIGTTAAFLMFLTGKPQEFNQFVQRQCLQMNRKRKEITWIL